MTALAYSVLGTNHPVLFKALASSARGSLRSFEPQDLADTARAFAGLQIKDHLLFEGLASESAGKMTRFKPKDLAHTAWSFAALNLMEEPLFRVISSEARLRLSSFSPQDLARIALAFATLNIQDEDFTRVIASEAGRRASRFSSQDCARIAWSLAVLDPSAAQVYLRKVESRLPSLDLDSLEFLQFHQALVACGLRMPRTLPPQARLQPSLCQSAQTRATGSFQDSVHNSLLEIKARSPESFGHIHTGLIFDGIQTDIVAEVAGTSWVINCDDHILHIAGSRRSGTAIGADVIQDLILARRGYRVLHILDTTWNESTHPSKWLEAQLIRDGRPQLNR